jgi:hypothetical protein
MAAGMHPSGIFTAKRHIGGFFDGQRIDIRPQAHARPFAADRREHAGLRDRMPIGNAELIELFSNERARPDFLVAQFRMPMQFTPNRDDPFLLLARLGEQRLIR